MDAYFDRIKPLFDSTKLTAQELAKRIGISPRLIYNWNNGQKSYTKYLAKIAAYFNVSVDYLMGATDEKSPASAEADGLTEKEWELIRAFRAAPAGYQASALALLESAPPVPQVPGVGESGG